MKKIYKVLVSFIICLMMGVSMQAVSVQAATGNYKTWKQSDSRWGKKKVGNNGNMSSWGCKITSIAILMVHSGVEKESNFNPGVLLDRYEAKGLISHSNSISADGNLSNSALSKANSPNFYKEGTLNFNPTPFKEIRSKISDLLKQGYYVEVRVNNDGHSVAVERVDNNEVYIMDPGSSKTKLSQYDGGIAYAHYYRARSSSVTPSTDELKISQYNTPPTLRVGQASSIKGIVISEKSNISSLTVGVYNSSGKMITGKAVVPNVKSYNLVNLDKYVEFNKLPAGSYYYRVIAKNAKGTKTLINTSFKVVTDKITISNYNYPTSLKLGKAYSIKGIVSSEYSNISSVTVGVYNKSGKLMTGKTVATNSKSYNIVNIDKYVEFNKLSIGTYYYKVVVKNSSGTTTVVNKAFNVIK